MIKSSSRRMVGLTLALCSLAAAALLATAAPALAETCPNEQLRAEAHSTTLPDCRAYELVTPPFKEGSKAGIGHLGVSGKGLKGLSTNGSHMDVISFGNFGDAQNGFFENSYELTRTESGWTETSIDLPPTPFPESIPIDTTPELGAILYEARAADQSLKAKDFWLREVNGTMHDIGPFEPPADTEGSPGPETLEVFSIAYVGGEFLAASPDLSHLMFLSPVSWPGDEAYGPASSGYYYGILYEYAVGRSGPPMPVGVEPGGSPCAAGYDGISADGATVFFECSGKLFARIDNGEAGARTLAVSEGPAAFWTATPDGGYAFYIQNGELWRFAVNSDTREALAGAGSEVQSGVAVGEGGEYVYFVANGVLAGRNVEGKEPVAGQNNLYLRHGGETTFIAAISPGEPRATPDGQFLVFTSTADLTSDDTSTAQQIFEYDAQTGDLVRVSIGQNGFNDDGNTDAINAELPEKFYQNPQLAPVAVSANGAYVVFQSADGLTPGALNGVVKHNSETGSAYYINNVYEYHGGNVYLISDGQDTSAEESYSAVNVEGMSSSGENIFFATADQLVSQDVDTEVDMYDARIDGGFPAPVSLLPTCQGDACQGTLSAAPTLLSPGSEFQAGGNPPLAGSEPASVTKPKPRSKHSGCKNGEVKKGNRCVKKPKTKKAKAKKSSNNRRGRS